ncbi:hypothetical protein Tco_1225646, partial [Tanacetum coccineum]
MRDYPNQPMVTLVEEDAESAPKYDSDGDEIIADKLVTHSLAKTSPFLFALVVAEENDIGGSIPAKVQPLVQEFADILPEEILLAAMMTTSFVIQNRLCLYGAVPKSGDDVSSVVQRLAPEKKVENTE